MRYLQNFSNWGMYALRGVAIAAVGLLACAGSASADTVINFSNSQGYGIGQDLVMIENILVEYVTANPFDPSHPTIETVPYNVPFRFDYATMHLIPDLDSSTGDDSNCATLDVYVTDAFTGSAIPDAQVSIGSRSLSTDQLGQVSFVDIASGTGFIRGNAPGYVETERQVNLSCSEPTSIGLAMTAEQGEGSITADQARIVLTWGENPRDLDSHLTGPDANNSGDSHDTSNRFHVYYSDPSTDVANLDVDDVDSFGPETITMDTQRPGLYRYSVYHFSGESDIPNSNASVTLQVGNEVRQYVPPAGQPGGVDTLWTVFELLVDRQGGITIYDVNTYSQGYGFASTPETTTGYGSVETGIDFSQLPAK